MKSGQGHGPAKKKFVACRGAGIVTGIVLVAVLMPFPLAATVDRTEDLERAGTVTAAAEAARKAAEQVKIEQQQQPPPPAPQPAAKPEDSARLAEEMRQERARLEAEANDIEAQRKAAEAKRSADERAQDEARVAEDRRRAAAADSDKNRTRKIVLSTEPIPRADRKSVDAVRQPAPEVRSVHRAPTDVSAAGPVVRRWIWRAGNRRCSRAGRRVTLPGRYTVQAGDSLWRISRRHYHSGLLYAKIYCANRSVVRNPDLIYPCQSIFVPRRH